MNIHKTKLAFSLVELSVVIIIIGILVVGVSKGTLIIRDAKLKTARSLTTTSPINSMEGLSFWLDTTYPDIIAIGTVASSYYSNDMSDGISVVKWKDHNPQNQNPGEISAVADINRPTYISSGINGLPSINFDGVNDYLTTTPGIIPSEAKSYSFAAVFSINNIEQPGMAISQGGLCAGGDLGMLISSNISYIGCGDNGGGDISSGLSLIKSGIPVYALINVDKNKTTNQFEFHTYKESDQTSSPMYSLNSTSFAIGRQVFNGQYPFAGNISEIVIFNRFLQSYEIQAIKDYFAKKYGIKN